MANKRTRKARKKKMKHKARTKKEKIDAIQEIVKDKKQMLRQLRKDDMIVRKKRFCEYGDKKVPCCQARTCDGTLCKRPSMFGGSIKIPNMECCDLCWQHAKEFGVYGLFKLLKMAADQQLSWGEYYALHPEEVLSALETTKKYIVKVCQKIFKKLNP